MEFFLVVGLTSVGAYLIGVKWIGLSSGGLVAGVVRMWECIGAALIFTVVNFSVAGGAILTIRVATGHFMSLYILGDATWLVLSLLQGLAWERWLSDSGR